MPLDGRAAFASRWSAAARAASTSTEALLRSRAAHLGRRHVRAAAGALRAGPVRRRPRPPQAQAGHGSLRQDRNNARVFVSSAASRSDAMSPSTSCGKAMTRWFLRPAPTSAGRWVSPAKTCREATHASDFVAWYNGHPDFRDCQFDLDCEIAVGGRPWQCGARRGADSAQDRRTNFAIPTSPAHALEVPGGKPHS